MSDSRSMKPPSLPSVEDPDEAYRGDFAKKESMQDSEMTPFTETESISEEEATNSSGWVGSFAKSVKDNVPSAINGFASFIHRSAMTVAAEIAQLEREAELETERWREENYGKDRGDELHLPWEVPHHSRKLRSSIFETIYEEDDELKEKIFDLSRNEDSFLVTSEGGDKDSSFSLDEPRSSLIRRLLELDDNLSARHAKFSGRSDIKETAFWRSYFCQCERVRKEHLAQKAEVVDLSDSGASLGPLLVTNDKGDDSSYEYVKKGIASPPSSANTDYSIGDMVLVRAESRELQELDD